MLLREFLYVDTEKTRGLLAQITGGVEEQVQSTTRQSKNTELGIKSLAQHGVTWGSDEQTSKSLGDALFPLLEEALDANGLLTDISEELQSEDRWKELPTEYPPGSIIRLTAPASLFDARYLATSFAGLAATAQGLAHLGVIPTVSKGGAQAGPPKKNQKAQGSNARPAVQQPPAIEDAIPDFAVEGLAPDDLRAIVKVARGIFKPGLHMVSRPTPSLTHAVSARLQEGRSYLDSDPEILFARYGLAAQDWTIVGSVGHYSPEQAGLPDYGTMADAAGNISRAGLTQVMNSFIQYFGRLGFVDLPQYPGFSLVPFAVYRTVGTSET